MYNICFITFGCKVNQYETDCMADCFKSAGFEISAEENADVFVINSCTVTGSGDGKSLYKVRKLRRDYPNSVIVLTGCLPQANPETAGKCTEADIVTGTKEREKLPKLVMQIINERSRIVDIPEYSSNDIYEDISCNQASKTRAFLKIQDGCNCFCSYCIIPYARGRCRSKPMKSLIEDAKALAEAGHKEIVLVGINLAFYGKEYGLRLVDAVEECCRIDGIERVRLGSLEPEMISNDDLTRLSCLKKFCPQFHLSLQSGSRWTLQRMHRKYTPEEYMTLVKKIRHIFPDASFTTDVMVGFPQETEEEFAESMEFVGKVGFAKIHVFQYSPRNGTIASRLNGQIPKNIKAERADRMKALGDKLQKKYMQSLIGKTVPVLFERENSAEYHQGHAPDYTLIKILRKNPKKSLRNQIFYVIIEESHDDYCLGKILD